MSDLYRITVQTTGYDEYLISGQSEEDVLKQFGNVFEIEAEVISVEVEKVEAL